MRNKYLLIVLKWLCVIMVVGLSFGLRWDRHDSVPLKGESWDEYSYSWVGLSLIRLGLPVGISGMDGYKTHDERYVNVDWVFRSTAYGNPVVIDRPWFDHPPLLGLITGSFAYAKGARVFEDTGTFIIRKPVIAMGALSVLLVILIGWVNFGFQTGLVAGIVYGTIPLIVVSSRMVQGENGLMPFILGSVLAISWYIRKRNRVFLFASAILAGLGTLVKLSGVATILMVELAILLETKRDRKEKLADMIFFGGVSLPFISLFFIYGNLYDWEVFVNLFKSNSGRFYGIGPAAIYNLMTQTKLTHHKTMSEAWPLAGWMAVLLMMIKQKKTEGDKLVILMLISYLAVYLLMGSQPYGWYALPFWPILCLAFGRIVVWGMDTPKNYLLNFWLLVIPFGFGVTRLVDIKEFQNYAGVWRWGSVMIILGLAIASLVKGKWKNGKVFFKLVFWLMLLFSVFANIKFLGTMDVDFWYKVS